jgi:putative endonuclease
MSRARVRLGEIGEDLAVRELERLGYAILARRYRTPRGEIDIVCTDGPAVVFIEVKTREEGSAFGTAAEAVTGLKRRRLIETARDFLGRTRLHDGPCRFDVVTVAVGEDGPAVEVVRHAFDLTG